MRAHLLSKGVFILETIPGQRSGGYVDENLLRYQAEIIAALSFKPNNKVTQDGNASLASMGWSRNDVFVPIPATGYYFPAIYVPQALGLRLGEIFGLSVQHSYYLARLFVILTSALLIGIAFSIFPPNPLVIALTILPMSIFQFFSASIDGVAFSLTLFCISLFMRGSFTKYSYPSWMSYALMFGLFILVTSRVQVLVFVCMPFILAAQRRKALHIWQGLCLIVLSLGWLYMAIKLTNDGGLQHPKYSHFDLLKYYLMNIPVLTQILLDTVTETANRTGYLQGVIGILGWLDTYFSSKFYAVMAWCLVAVSILSMSLADFKETWLPRLGLVAMFLLSMFTVFFALLIQWNPFPTATIAGVQGRYFIIPLCALGYALSGDAAFKSRLSKVIILFLLIMLGMTATKMPQLLLERYFISASPVQLSSGS